MNVTFTNTTGVPALLNATTNATWMSLYIAPSVALPNDTSDYVFFEVRLREDGGPRHQRLRAAAWLSSLVGPSCMAVAATCHMAFAPVTSVLSRGVGGTIAPSVMSAMDLRLRWSRTRL